MRVKGIWGISVPFCQFCCKPKTALKKKSQKELTLRVDIFGKIFISLLHTYTCYTRIYTCVFVGLI